MSVDTLICLWQCMTSLGHEIRNMQFADNMNRVFLRAGGAVKGAEYINASFIDVSQHTSTCNSYDTNHVHLSGVQAQKKFHSHSGSTEKYSQ